MTAVAGDTGGRGHDSVAASPPASRGIQPQGLLRLVSFTNSHAFLRRNRNVDRGLALSKGRFGEPGPQTAATAYTSRGYVGA